MPLTPRKTISFDWNTNKNNNAIAQKASLFYTMETSIEQYESTRIDFDHEIRFELSGNRAIEYKHEIHLSIQLHLSESMVNHTTLKATTTNVFTSNGLVREFI